MLASLGVRNSQHYSEKKKFIKNIVSKFKVFGIKFYSVAPVNQAELVLIWKKTEWVAFFNRKFSIFKNFFKNFPATEIGAGSPGEGFESNRSTIEIWNSTIIVNNLFLKLGRQDFSGKLLFHILIIPSSLFANKNIVEQ